MTTALVIGAGPAGLMAAEVLSAAGVAVTLADRMPSVGRKFLMAGKSGLNLTKITADFEAAFGEMPPALATAVAGFGPDAIMAWAEGLGQPLFTGSTGRVFPKAMKASPLLRAWLQRLDAQGVTLRTRHRWIGWQDGAALFQDHPATRADVYVLALGGGSWARLGSDGRWWDQMSQVMPFRPANCGFVVDWSSHMAPHLGKPVKGVALTSGDLQSRGEFVISARGIEGGGIYEVSAAMRDGAPLVVDLVPDLSLDRVQQALAKPRGKASLSNHLRKVLRLDPVRIALLNEFGRPFGDDFAIVIKGLRLTHQGPRPLDEAISTAGGLRFDALNYDLMFHSQPGLFAAGEMLDWEAPTGGYLISASLATGRHAAQGALRWTGNTPPAS